MIDAMAERDNDPNSPAELGRRVLAACRWSDDMRRLALEGFRYRCPGATAEELDEMLYRFRLQWERTNQRLRRRQSALRRDG